MVQIQAPRPLIPPGIIELRRLRLRAFSRRFALVPDSVPSLSISRASAASVPRRMVVVLAGYGVPKLQTRMSTRNAHM